MATLTIRRSNTPRTQIEKRTKKRTINHKTVVVSLKRLEKLQRRGAANLRRHKVEVENASSYGLKTGLACGATAAGLATAKKGVAAHHVAAKKIAIIAEKTVLNNLAKAANAAEAAKVHASVHSAAIHTVEAANEVAAAATKAGVAATKVVVTATKVVTTTGQVAATLAQAGATLGQGGTTGTNVINAGNQVLTTANQVLTTANEVVAAGTQVGAAATQVVAAGAKAGVAATEVLATTTKVGLKATTKEVVVLAAKTVHVGAATAKVGIAGGHIGMGALAATTKLIPIAAAAACCIM